ncbi:hypothetical protein AB4305_24430 [Nocardia sp. 2YAB30]|uniref:hypothetical protein n=1 Tax=Nocardia sp. 2YAB30 TaxID=3233022 RepID=UPI003F981C34
MAAVRVGESVAKELLVVAFLDVVHLQPDSGHVDRFGMLVQNSLTRTDGHR